MLQRTIPNLDAEIEYLSRNDAYTLINRGLKPNQGIQLRCFEPGQGEWFEYYRENPTGQGLLYYKEHHAVQRNPVRGDLLSTIGKNTRTGNDYVKDIVLVPVDRMPEWGDGSVHYTCCVCGSPIIATERTYTSRGAVHDCCEE